MNEKNTQQSIDEIINTIRGVVTGPGATPEKNDQQSIDDIFELTEELTQQDAATPALDALQTSDPLDKIEDALTSIGVSEKEESPLGDIFGEETKTERDRQISFDSNITNDIDNPLDFNQISSQSNPSEDKVLPGATDDFFDQYQEFQQCW